jgi:hypothetical protein
MVITNDLSSLTNDSKSLRPAYDKKKSSKGKGEAPCPSKVGHSMGTGSKRCQIRETRYSSTKDAQCSYNSAKNPNQDTTSHQ